MEMNLIAELRAAGYALVETHISCVFLGPSDVYKLKRAVSLGFLDFSTLALREAACLAEVQLNRRLAPGVYLGVVALVRAPSGTLCFVDRDTCRAGEALEWAVHMRRLDDQSRADTLLAADSFGPHDVETLAVTIANFHRASIVTDAIGHFGSPEAIEGNVLENFTQMADQVGRILSLDEQRRLIDHQTSFLRHERELLHRRVRTGSIRDGHGDLRLEHCYRRPDGTYAIIDCIEFNERFRFGDVCADVAFLAMDLSRCGRPDLADLFVAAYARASADYGVYDVLDFYLGYRATVRAKVSAMLASDEAVSAAARAAALHEARRYFLLAIAAGQRPLRRPLLIVTFGLIASGKSTVAAALAERLGAARLAADHTRKELLGLAPEQPKHEAAFTGAYDSSTTARVYDTLFARAEQVLRSGRSVVLDATFRSRGERSRAGELARQYAAEPLFVECWCPRELAFERLRRRALGPSESDGRAEIYDAVAASFEASDELVPATHLTLDTSHELAETLARVYAVLERRPQHEGELT